MKWSLLLAIVAVVPTANAGETVPSAADHECCAVFELRQYKLKSGERDLLIEIFDREFVESQELLGMRLYGQFRDADDAERFVWIRAFPDMEARKQALTAFYSGPVWKAYGRQAAGTMIDASNVLLLHSADPPHDFAKLPAARAAVGATAVPDSVVLATIYPLKADAAGDFTTFFRTSVQPALQREHVDPIGVFETEHSINTYQPLPVREGEHVFVWFALFPNMRALSDSVDRLAKSAAWSNVDAALSTRLISPPQKLRLRPTARSLLR
jgi:hypothetical protein